MSNDATNLSFDAKLRRRHLISGCFAAICRLATWSSLLLLGILLCCIIWRAWGWIDWQFLTSYDHYKPEKSGILAGIWGTFWLLMLTIMISVPLGIGSAVYLEEYSADTWLTRVIKINLANLAGVPSIVYGILGLTVFVRMFGMIHPDKEMALVIPLLFTKMRISLPFDRTILSGSLTLSLLILPVVIIASQEALRAVPPSIRHASIALGASRWQTIRYQILPAALPGVVTGVILSVSRAIGETAPLIMAGAFGYIASTPGGIESPVDILRDPAAITEVPSSSFTAIPIQIYGWASESRQEYQYVAAAGILVLLLVLLAFNGLAVYIRHRSQKKIAW